MGIDYTDLEFDEEKYYLGTLCKRGHDWNNTGFTLRYVKGMNCPLCRRVTSNYKYRRKRPIEIVFNSDKHFLGELCYQNHEYKNSNKSIRQRRDGVCLHCKRLRQREYYYKHKERIDAACLKRNMARNRELGVKPQGSRLSEEEKIENRRKAVMRWAKRNPEARRRISLKGMTKKRLFAGCSKEILNKFSIVVEQQVLLRMQMNSLKKQGKEKTNGQ
jgi:hypothetical protein